MSSETEQPDFQLQPSFDLQSLVIDDQLTQEFFTSKGDEEIGSNILRMAGDKDGNQVLLKTSTFFKGEKQVLTRSQLKDEYPSLGISEEPDEFLAKVEESLRLQEAAYKLATYVGVPMAESWLVEVSDTPYIALKYLPGAKDRGFGSRIDFEPDQGQARDLALGALFKFLVNANQDDGQYLQASDGKLYLSDLSLNPYLSASSLEHALLFMLSQGGSIKHPIHQFPYESTGYFAISQEALHYQLQAINSLSFQTALKRLEGLTPEKALALIAKNSSQPTETEQHMAQALSERAQQSRPLFTLMADLPEVAESALNPYISRGQRVSSKEDMAAARQTLIEELQRRSTL